MLLKNKIYLVLGIDTDIGKTYFTTKICQKLISQNQKILAIKPVISGFDINNIAASDSGKILQSLNLKINQENLDKISPWRFKTPISPNLAAKKEGKEVFFDKIVNFCQENIAKAQNNNEFLFIEAAGGVMSPVSDDKNFLDLANILQIPILLISANYLGSISHSLCALKALQSSNLEVEKTLINDGLSQLNKEFFQNHDEFISILQNFSNCEIETISQFLS